MISRRKTKGFTLIELIVVVAIVGILAAIAYPGYRDSVLKGRRAQARTAIVELIQQQERYMTQNNTYLVFSNTAGTTSVTTPFNTFAGESPATASYWLSAARCDATQLENVCIMITAVPIQADPVVGNLSMNTEGVKTCTGSAQTSNPAMCWP